MERWKGLNWLVILIADVQGYTTRIAKMWILDFALMDMQNTLPCHLAYTLNQVEKLSI